MRAATTQMLQPNIMKELTYGPQMLLFPTPKLATSYLFLPLGTATVERSFSTLNRIACAERIQLFQIKASGLPILHILLKVQKRFLQTCYRKRNERIVQNCMVHLIECAK